MLLAFSALSPVVSFYIGGDAVLHLAGTGAALAYLVGGVISVALALLYAEVGAAFPGAGGLYPSLAALFGPLLAFPYIVLMVPIVFAATGFTALGLADYVRVLAPGLPLLPVALAGLVAASIIAVLSIRLSTLVTGTFLTIEAIALATLIGVAVLHPAHPLGQVLAHPVMLRGGVLASVPLATLGLATVSGVWATAGANWALYFAEEMHDAQRKIGRAITWTGAIAAIVVAAPMILLVMSAKDPREMLAADAPIAAFLLRAGGPVIAGLVSVGVIAAIFNSLVANMMGFSRYLYATGRDGIWPAWISRVLGTLHPRFRSPVWATALIVVVAALSMLFGEKALLILISGNVSDYLLISIAVLVGRRQGTTGRHYRVPLHPFFPIFGLTVTALSILADWLDPEAGRPSTILLIGLFLGGLVYYHFRLRQVSKGWGFAVAAVEVEVVEIDA
jgi:amino acid transporter